MFWLSSKKIILYLHTLNESRISGKGVHMYKGVGFVLLIISHFS